jgi:predicted AlkP superfamily phosphohydrolase/phosphomutase
VLVSDHGQGKMLRYVNLNAWLMSKDLLVLTSEGAKRLQQGDTITTLKINGYDYYARIKPKLTAHDIEWSKTKAYSVNNELININLQGREGRGCVRAGEEYDEVREYVKEELLKLEDGMNRTGIVEEVYYREELYEGEHVNKLPDIMFTYKGDSLYYNPSLNIGYFPHREILYDKAPDHCFELERSAHHTRHGIFLAYGPDINEGKKVTNAENIDVAPTVLHLLGIPIPEDMDGKVLRQIIRRESPLAAREITREKVKCQDSAKTDQESGYTEEEEKEIERRLKALGYV